MVVTTGGEKRRGIAETLHDLKSGQARNKSESIAPDRRPSDERGQSGYLGPRRT
jgi:hypothetical protein